MFSWLRKTAGAVSEFAKGALSLKDLLSELKWVLLALAILILVSTLLFVLVRESHPDQESSPSGPTDTAKGGSRTDSQEHARPDPNWKVTSGEFFDSMGHRVPFKIMVMSRDFAWTFNDAHTVQYHGQPEPMRPHLESPGISADIRAAVAVVAVGAASEEGSRREEHARAQERAEQLQKWIKEAVPGTSALFTLSVGQFINNGTPVRDSDKTATERRVVVIGIINPDPGIDFKSPEFKNSLRMKLQTEEAFPFNLSEYSDFNLGPWR